MNLFRSEAHARSWSGFTQEAEGGLLTLGQLCEIFSAPLFRERPNGHYITNMAELRGTLFAAIKTVTNDHPFWRVP
jgi:hypothetical protein